MTTLRELLHLLLWIFWVFLVARLVLSYVQTFARDWRPRGIVLVIAETVYTVTDPPLRLLRRILPPIRLGPIALDTGFLVLFIIVGLLMNSV